MIVVEDVLDIGRSEARRVSQWWAENAKTRDLELLELR